jgi:hypothetical protein
VLACGGDSSGDGTADDASTGAPTMTLTDPSTDPSVDDSDASTSGGSDSSTSSDPDDSSTTETESCPETHVCLATPPEGWEGPVVRLQRPALAPEESCPTEYPNQQVNAGVDVLAEPATCTCSCGDATEVLCETSSVLHYYGVSATCSDVVPGNFTIYSTMCNPLPGPFAGASNWSLDPVVVGGGACEPALEQSMDAPSFANVLTTCGGAELLPGCGTEQICAPRIGDELCIWQSGDSRCPTGYADRHLYFGTIDDQRTCEACSCGDPVGLCDDALAFLYDSPNCNVPVAGGIAGDGECHPTGAPLTRTATLVVGEPTAFCEPSTSAAMGEAVGSMPTTVCCAS